MTSRIVNPIKMFEVRWDPCACLTTQPSIFTLPNFSWTLPAHDSAPSNKPSNFNVGYFYPADPSYPIVRRSDNDCWGTFTASVDDSNWAGLVDVTAPASSTGAVELVFSETCADTDNGLVDSNNNACAAYTADAGNTPLTFTCGGGNDGMSGFDAAAMCCYCGGGSTSFNLADFDALTNYANGIALTLEVTITVTTPAAADNEWYVED